MLAQPAQLGRDARRCRRSPGRPRTKLVPAASACRRPAGPPRAGAGRRAPVARPSASNAPGGAPARVGAGARAPHDQPPGRRLDERARPRLVGADLALEVSAPAARDRAGRPRAGAAASASRPRPAAGAASMLTRAATARASARAAPRRRRRAASSSSGAVSVPSRAIRVAWATIGPVSSPSSIRISVTPVSGSPARIAAGIGVAPRWRGSSDGCRLSAPCGRSEQRRRHDLAVVGEDDEPGSRPRTSAIASGSRSRAGVRIGVDAESLGGVARSASRSAPCCRPAGRGGAVTTPTSSIVGMTGERPRVGTPNPPLPRKTVRTGRGLGPVRSREGARRLADLRVVLLVALADRHQLVHRLEVVDVELAVEVVELVLERAAEQPRCRRP